MYGISKKNYMDKISISCKCTTAGRVHLLEELLYSFLHQKYEGQSELVIVNDYEHQTLHFSDSRVRIFNCNPFPTIGHKENFAIEQCRFDNIAVFDDDDWAEPNHLENINKYLPGYGLLHWNNGVFWNKDRIVALRCLGNSGICYTKEAWIGAGRYPLGNAGSDMDFVINIQKAGFKVSRAAPENKDASWWYRWGMNNYNQSGMGHDKNNQENILIRHKRYLEDLRIKGKIPTGDIELVPRRNADYTHLLKDFVQKHNNNGVQ
jgi:glycosyltransferase involved in cell wall biosynthesis